MMREQRELEEYFDGFLRERRGTLNIGAPAFFCTYVLPALVKKFGEEHLDAKVNIIEAGVDDLANCPPVRDDRSLHRPWRNGPRTPIKAPR